MRLPRAVSALCGVVLAATVVAPVPAVSAPADPRGLWSTHFDANQTSADCGRWRLDDNDFCVANDSRNGLEIGVTFKTSRELDVVGIRIYRVDPAAVRGSLWDASGTLLSRGDFDTYQGNGWQDMRFAEPVRISPGESYVASYFTPATKYAFDYQYFSKKGRKVGPVTALRARDGKPNGVHCYDDAKCGDFPVWGYRNSTYWVTPLWQVPDTTASPTDPPTNDQTRPRVTRSAPAKNAARVKVGKSVRVKLSERVRRSTLRPATVRLLRKGKSKPVSVRVRYNTKSSKFVIDPRSTLRHKTKYRVVISTRVRDLAGNRLDQRPGKAGLQKAAWTFRTR